MDSTILLKMLDPSCSMSIFRRNRWIGSSLRSTFCVKKFAKVRFGFQIFRLLQESKRFIFIDVIPLTDSFNFSDYLINSPFGRYDGNMYD
jgi:hypothetical protein